MGMAEPRAPVGGWGLGSRTSSKVRSGVAIWLSAPILKTSFTEIQAGLPINKDDTVKPRFTAGFGGKETSAVNRGLVCLQYAY